jgi:hypothetical protein
MAMNRTNGRIQHLEADLEELYDAIAGSDPDSDYYHTMSERIANKKADIATERMAIDDLSWDGE